MLTPCPGACCVVHDGKVVGALAVSGGGSSGFDRWDSDWDFAEVAFKALGPGFSHSDVNAPDQPVYVDTV